jgi:hypothetical protein
MKIVDIHILFSEEKCKISRFLRLVFFTPEIDFENEP